MSVALDGAAAALDELVSAFAESHRNLLQQLLERDVAALKQENERLLREVKQLRSQPMPPSKARTPPPVPWPPSARANDRFSRDVKASTSPSRRPDLSRTPPPLPWLPAAGVPRDSRVASPVGEVGDDIEHLELDASRGASRVSGARLPGMVRDAPLGIDTPFSEDRLKATLENRIKVTEADLGRLRGMFFPGGGATENDDLEVTPALLESAVNTRLADLPIIGDDLDIAKARIVLREFKAAYSSMAGPSWCSPAGGLGGNDPDVMPFIEFTEALYNDALEEHLRCSDDQRTLVLNVVGVLRQRTIDEIVGEVTNHAGYVRQPAPKPRPLWLMENIVSLAVVVDVCNMGISADLNPQAWYWLLMECICVSVFIAEVATKLRYLGWRNYLRGQGLEWHYLDIAITLISVVEVSINVAEFHLGAPQDSGVMSSARVFVMLRILRLLRAIRMVKLVKHPMLRDLANLLVGFMVGLPALFWVLVFFVLVLFMIGITFRFMFGPDTGEEDLEAICGPGDNLQDFNDPVCKISHVYGQEFFGSVPKAMFTCFRFMLGDFTTFGGKSIVIAFEKDYGFEFRIFFVTWMLVVMFGLFNIITAIFVDATVAGLKHNDVKRKYIQQYERKYVAGKLNELLERAESMMFGPLTTDTCRAFPKSWCADTGPSRKVAMTEKAFVRIMEDETVRQLLSDLDIDIFNPAGMFYTFDGQGNGTLSLEELAHGIMKLRGDLQKCDLIASWVSTRSLHYKFDALREQLDQSLRQNRVPSDGVRRQSSPSRELTDSPTQVCSGGQA